MPGELLSSLDGVTLSVVVDPNPVPRGEAPSFVATLRNARGETVDYSSGGCAFANLNATFPVPWEGSGRSWTGQEGWFKNFLLSSAYGPGGVPAWAPVDATLLHTPCDQPVGEGLLRPGQRLTADFSFAVRNSLTTYPHVSAIPFSISAQIDRQNDPPPPDPAFTGLMPPRFFPIYRKLTVEGELKIEGEPADVLSAGEAIDALLETDEFVRWLRDQPPTTCETANLFLESGPGPDFDSGWEISLFCETGVPRHFFGARVDALTGEVKRLEFCTEACG